MPLPVRFIGTAPGQVVSWATPTEAMDVSLFSDIEIQVIGTPSSPYTPQRSLDGTNWVNTNAYDKDGNTLTTLTTAGIFTIEGGAWLRLNGGGGSTFLLRGAL